MVTEEETRRNTLKENIEQYKSKLSQLCAELHVAPIQPTASRLYEIERELSQSLTSWRKVKESRLSDLKELKGIEQALCDIMHATPFYIQSGSVPTQEDLDKLRKHIDELAAEKIKRYETFLAQKEAIERILEDIGEEITTEFEQDVLLEDPQCFILSSSNMAKLNSLTQEFKAKQAARIKEMDGLKEKIESLWNRLDVIMEERRQFLEQIWDHSPASVATLKEELEKCEALKFEHLQDFTVKVREELTQWWDKCHYSQKQRSSFTAFTSEDYSEELLAQHEAALEEVKQYYTENEHVLKKIEKRADLWNQMLAFDAKENDPNRYKNRGGNLLAEEREKKKVLHQLPKVEEQLKNEVEAWEEENGRKFFIGGMHFFEYCRLQWEEYKLSKELQKQQRLEQKEKDKQSEIRFGSKPTPLKRRIGATTPSQTPKQRKLNDTTRSATRLNSLSRINSVFTSPVTPAKSTRTPLRQTRTAGNLPTVTPQSSRKGVVPRTPMSAMGPPRGTMSTRSAARKLKDTPKAKSCVALASPKLKQPSSKYKGKDVLKRSQSELSLCKENKLRPYTSDEIVSQPSGSSTDLASDVPSYKEFESLLDSAKKSKQYRSTICSKK
ncbi:PRC1 [Bugula neritina]|uniref:PRC1 n=1 Tax=Bugula neritina TaxID=10212 RepID=A0A7J7J291_BUGNE|nr:PRC1 [Bugula neritina]